MEVLTSDFVQLRPQAAQGGADDEVAQDDCFMFDDDDNYQYEVSRMHQWCVPLMQSTCLAYREAAVYSLPIYLKAACTSQDCRLQECALMPGGKCGPCCASREAHRQRARTMRQAQLQQAKPGNQKLGLPAKNLSRGQASSRRARSREKVLREARAKRRSEAATLPHHIKEATTHCHFHTRCTQVRPLPSACPRGCKVSIHIWSGISCCCQLHTGLWMGVR